MEAPRAHTHPHPRADRDGDGDDEKEDEGHVVEAVVQVDGEAGEHAREKRKHLPRPHKGRHREHRDHEARVRAHKVGQLQAVVVEDAERVELLVARVVELVAIANFKKSN